MTTSEHLYLLNALYWFKDQMDKDIQKLYLQTLQKLAEDLGYEHLSSEIETYLKLI